MDMYIGISSKLITGAIGIFILLRIMGKKTMSELTPFDLIYILLLGAVVEEAIYDDKVNVLHVLFAIVIWGLFVYAIEKALQHTDKFSTFIEGEPAILIEKGRLNLIGERPRAGLSRFTKKRLKKEPAVLLEA